MNKDVEGIWKYLHHLLSGAILLIEGIFLGVLNKSIIAMIVFVGIGAFLFIDDLLAETIDKSIFDNFHSNPIRLKVVGALFFIFMQIIFVSILFY